MLERDEETGQDHAWWRKYENTAGRWTTPDPYTGSMSIGDPQSLNRYSYVGNDPVNRIDPSGLEETVPRPDFSMFWDFIGYVNAGPGFIPGGADNPELIIKKAKMKVKKLLTKDCIDFLTNLVLQALKQINTESKDTQSDETLRTNAESLIGGLTDVLDQAKQDFTNADKSNSAHDMAIATGFGATATINYYKDFFATAGQQTLTSGIGPLSGTYYSERDETARAQTLIHEGLHLLLPGFTDARLGGILNGKPLTGKPDEQKRKGSDKLNKLIAEKCSGK